MKTQRMIKMLAAVPLFFSTVISAQAAEVLVANPVTSKPAIASVAPNTPRFQDVVAASKKSAKTAIDFLQEGPLSKGQTDPPRFTYEIEKSGTVENGNTQIRILDTATNTTYKINYGYWVDVRALSFQGDGKLAKIEYRDREGSQQFQYYVFEHKALSYGYAPSNSDFIFAFYQDGIGENYVVNLKTGQPYGVGQCSNYACTSPVDVSPDGKWIITGYSGYSPYQDYVFFMNIETGALIDSAPFSTLKFISKDMLAGTRVARQLLGPFDDRIMENVLVDLKNQQIKITSYSLQRDAYVSSSNGFVLLSVYSKYHLFDATKGTDKMQLIKSFETYEGLPEEGYASPVFFDAAKWGKKVIFTISYMIDNQSESPDLTTWKTMIVSSWGVPPLLLDGKITSLRMLGPVLFYTWQKPDGKMEHIFVDRNTMKIIQVPDIWKLWHKWRFLKRKSYFLKL